MSASNSFLVAAGRMPLDHGFQQPPPALAIVFRRVPTCWHRVVNRIALGVYRRTLWLTAEVAPAFFIVGQSVEVSERLQPPGLSTVAVEHHGVGKLFDEL